MCIRDRTTFARQWHENTEKLQQLQREQSAQKAECESYASFLPSLTKEVEEATLRQDVYKRQGYNRIPRQAGYTANRMKRAPSTG